MNRQFNDRETAVHILTVLREDIGQYPAFSTPKYPLPAIMHTERQIALMKEFGEKGACDLTCLGVDEDEIILLRDKARVLRARVFVRWIKRNEKNADEAREMLARMARRGEVSFEDLRLSESRFTALIGGAQ